MAETKLFHDLFVNFNTRYDGMNEALAEIAKQQLPLSDQQRNVVVDYFNLCAGCHGRDSEGVPHVAPGLRDNSSVRDADPHNLIVAILDGLPEHDLPGLERMQDMPGFARDLGDADIAALSTWLRGHYGGSSVPIEAEAVRELRHARSNE